MLAKKWITWTWFSVTLFIGGKGIHGVDQFHLHTSTAALARVFNQRIDKKKEYWHDR